MSGEYTVGARVQPRVVIVAEHASARYGGEAALPLHYFRLLRQRGRDVWLVVHARTRDELSALFPDESRIHYVEDSRFHLWMWRLGCQLPRRIDYVTTSFAMRIATQLAQRRIVRRLVAEHGANLIHQPIPVSPKEPSLMAGFGVPVVMGPMNGGIDFPPAFRRYQSRGVSAVVALGRLLSAGLHWVMPGKRHADALLVANERTRLALPKGVRGRVIPLVENGVDLRLWAAREAEASSASRRASAQGADAVAPAEPQGPTQSEAVNFLFMGRLVDWKAVDLLLQAFRELAQEGAASLTLVGDGEERQRLVAMCLDWGLLATRDGEPGKVWFAGWQTQSACADYLARCDALILPSLMECGGAVVLEAMAASRPVIATHWGGPADYLDASCGLLVTPDSAASMVRQLTAAMQSVQTDPAAWRARGRAGRQRVAALFDWEVKMDSVETIYGELVAADCRNKRPDQRPKG